MSSSTEKNPETKKDDKEEQPPQLGALEEDDEFEEFETQDWDDTETDLSKLTSAGSGSANAQAGDNLWEDNWDDDDVEDEFSVQLRNELAKTAKGTATPAQGGTAREEPMAH